MASPSPAPDASGAVPQAGLAVEHEEQRDQPGHDHRHPHKLTEMHGDPRPAVRILGEHHRVIVCGPIGVQQADNQGEENASKHQCGRHLQGSRRQGVMVHRSHPSADMKGIHRDHSQEAKMVTHEKLATDTCSCGCACQPVCNCAAPCDCGCAD